jgi:hypothetical protein
MSQTPPQPLVQQQSTKACPKLALIFRSAIKTRTTLVTLLVSALSALAGGIWQHYTQRPRPRLSVNSIGFQGSPNQSVVIPDNVMADFNGCKWVTTPPRTFQAITLIEMRTGTRRRATPKSKPSSTG